MAHAQLGGEDITVTNSAIGPTAASVLDNVVYAQFNLRSGGSLHAQTFAAPTAGGNLGDHLFGVGDNWKVWGHDEVLNYLMIRTGGVSAVVGVQYFGTQA